MDTVYERELLDRVRAEAAEISRTERVANVFRLNNGRLIATTSTAHMIPGKLLEVFVDGAYCNNL